VVPTWRKNVEIPLVSAGDTLISDHGQYGWNDPDRVKLKYLG
jgi:hypothetical protein